MQTAPKTRKKIIFHVDVNSAFLSWEAAYRIRVLGQSEDLRDIPSAIGGDVEKRHGIILAKSIPAKKYGIQTGEPVVSALKKCPDLVLAPPNYKLYETSSEAVLKIMGEYTPKLEQYSIDEAFMDMTGWTKDPIATAYEIKDRIKNEIGCTVNVGISENMLLAKMASDFEKPDKVHTLWPEEVKEKMWPLPVGDLMFIGRATNSKLASLGIHTIGELAKMDRDILKSHFGVVGYSMHDSANGIDDSEICDDYVANKSVGNSMTTPADVTDMKLAKQYLLMLAETVSARLRSYGLKASTVTVGIRNNNLEYTNHQMRLKNATDLTDEIYEAACICLAQMWDGTPLRQFGISTSKIEEEETTRQLSLFDNFDYEKHKKAEKAMDELRERFGSDIVKRARLK